MASTFSTHFQFTLPHLHHAPPYAPLFKLVIVKPARTRRRPRAFLSFSSSSSHSLSYHRLNPSALSARSVLTRVSGDGGGAVDAGPQQSAAPDTEETKNSRYPRFSDSYVPLFVEMLGLDKDAQDREQAVEALWRYSVGGKKCVDDIMQFQGCLNLIVNLLKSESTFACEAAAGLIQTIAAINTYRDSVAESGAIEEIIGLLSRPSLSSEVKAQSLSVLWNLSVDERFRVKIANADVLPLLVKFLDDEFIHVRKAVGGVFANLALSHSNHSIMVEAGIIPKLAKLLKGEDGSLPFKREGGGISAILDEDLLVFRKEARNVLLELAKDEYYKILIIEEGLVPVPLIGEDTYRSFVPDLHSRPSFPDGVELKQNSERPPRYRASRVPVGISDTAKDAKVEKAKENALTGWSRQHHLARMGITETQYDEESKSRHQQFALLPWVDGVARLVLILQLNDDSAISRAAMSIADVAINEHMRTSFRDAGGAKRLVKLLDSKSEDVRLASISALDKLSVSYTVCQEIEDEGALKPLIDVVKNSESSGHMLEMALNILTRILDPSKAMKSKLCDESVNGSANKMDIQDVNFRNNVLDSAFIARLVNFLKTSSLDLQTKAASILEFVTFIESGVDAIILVDIQSGLHTLFQQNILSDMESDMEGDHPELYALKVEETGTAISAGARLLTKLLDHEKFHLTIDTVKFTQLLSELLKSSIPLQSKEWVSACLVKLTQSNSGERTIHMDVALYKTIPRLVEQMKSSFSEEEQEDAVVELNRIVSEGEAETGRAVARGGGIFPLVKLLEEGSGRAVEASLSLLYNLSMDSENHPTIISAGAVPILRRVVLAEKPQWQRALHLLRTLPI